MAVGIDHRASRVDMRLTLGELVRFLWPHITSDEQGRPVAHPTKTSYRPSRCAVILQEALRNLSWYCVLETKTGLWKPAVVRQEPKGYSAANFSDVIIFDIRMPEGYGPGPRVHRPTLRKWGRSALAYRSNLSIANYWNRHITGGGKIASPERPRVRRNDAGHLLDHAGNVILERGKPSKNWNDRRVVRLSGNERNPAMDRLPELGPDELVDLTRPDGHKLKGAKLRMARHHALSTVKKLSAEGDIVLEYNEKTEGTRILTPSDIAKRMKR